MQPQDIERDTFEQQPDNRYAQRVVVVPAQYTENQFQNIAAAGNTVVKDGKGKLVGIVINDAKLGSTVTLYDNNAPNTSNGGRKIGTIKQPALALLSAQANFNYNVDFQKGLTIVTTAADDITVIFR